MLPFLERPTVLHTPNVATKEKPGLSHAYKMSVFSIVIVGGFTYTSKILKMSASWTSFDVQAQITGVFLNSLFKGNRLRTTSTLCGTILINYCRVGTPDRNNMIK